MKVLIVAYYYPPLNAIGSHRPYWLAKYFQDMGAEVTILTSKKYDFDGPLDLNLQVLDRVDVIEIPYLTLKGQVISWASQRWFWGTLKRLYQKFSKVSRKVAANADPRGGWLNAAKEFSLKNGYKYDAVISSYSPKESHLIACEIKKKNSNVTWIADYRDHWSLPQGEKVTTKSEQLHEQKIELNTVGKYADLVTSISDEFTINLENFLGKPGLVFHNGHDLDQETVLKNIDGYQSRSKTEQINILHTGTIYPQTRNPEPLLTALERLQQTGTLQPNKLKVNFLGKNTTGILKYKNTDIGREFVSVMGYVPRDEALRMQQAADVLLLLSGSSDADKGVLTGKVFEYISSGVPIIAVGCGPDSAIGRLLQDTGTGIAVGEDVNALQDIIGSMLADGKMNAFNPNIEQIMKYSRVEQSGLVWNWLQQNTIKTDGY